MTYENKKYELYRSIQQVKGKLSSFNKKELVELKNELTDQNSDNSDLIDKLIKILSEFN